VPGTVRFVLLQYLEGKSQTKSNRTIRDGSVSETVMLKENKVVDQK